ncbi:MAG TPA: flagellar biosynthesis anti-sigma factor FlgM [Chitinispirillaceae bacterium]|nr:flagellar biosynthesis anti-sigma factor FlgM [Chitinispirillaceae bacterium]
MRINAVTQPMTSELQKIESVRKIERESKVSKTQPAVHSEISSDAQKLSETKAQFETIASTVSVQPEIRADKIDEVKKKIEDGFYNSEEFIDKLADKLLKDFGVK